MCRPRHRQGGRPRRGARARTVAARAMAGAPAAPRRWRAPDRDQRIEDARVGPVSMPHSCLMLRSVASAMARDRGCAGRTRSSRFLCPPRFASMPGMSTGSSSFWGSTAAAAAAARASGGPTARCWPKPSAAFQHLPGFPGALATIVATAGEARGKAGLKTTAPPRGPGHRRDRDLGRRREDRRAGLPFASVTVDNDAYAAASAPSAAATAAS